MVARIDLAQRTRQALIGLFAIGLGLLAGVDPKIAIAAAIGLAFVVLVIGDLTIGLCLFAVVAFLDVLPHIGGSLFSFSKFVGFSALSLTWAENAGEGTTPLLRYVLNVILFLIVYTAVKSARDFKWVVGAYVIGCVLAAASSALRIFLGATAR